ncbi:MAG TPA: amidohydrolase family protein [Thermomicrobiaceae bacterium]|nr:amidohydrolase family protein [Thermomicrobiaceae bacterium]
MIIDSHTHIDEAGFWLDPPETILRLMDEAGIEQAVVMTYRDAPLPGGSDPLAYVADACRRYPRLIGYARMNPRHGEQAVRELERAFRDLGMKGLKLHPVSYIMHPSSPETLELLRTAAAWHAPTLFHCGDEEFTLPYQIAQAAALVPEATIILGHMGGYFHVEDAIQAALTYPNLILETSAMPYPAMIKRAVDLVGAERVLFASDGPGCDPTLEVAKVRAAGLSAAEEELLFSTNIERILARVGR